MRLAVIGAAALILTSCSDGGPGKGSAAGLAPSAAGSQVLAAADLPRIKPGEWEVRTTEDGGAVDVVRQCVEADEAEILPTGSDDCPAKISKAGGVYIVESTCPSEGYVSHTRMTMRGDFQRRYAGELDLVVSAAGAEVSRYKQRMEARFIGPCP